MKDAVAKAAINDLQSEIENTNLGACSGGASDYGVWCANMPADATLEQLVERASTTIAAEDFDAQLMARYLKSCQFKLHKASELFLKLSISGQELEKTKKLLGRAFITEREGLVLHLLQEDMEQADRMKLLGQERKKLEQASTETQALFHPALLALLHQHTQLVTDKDKKRRRSKTSS